MLYMTDFEILKSYRLSKRKRTQIQILAELNACSCRQIEEAIDREIKRQSQLERDYQALLAKHRANTSNQYASSASKHSETENGLISNLIERISGGNELVNNVIKGVMNKDEENENKLENIDNKYDNARINDNIDDGFVEETETVSDNEAIMSENKAIAEIKESISQIFNNIEQADIEDLPSDLPDIVNINDKNDTIKQSTTIKERKVTMGNKKPIEITKELIDKVIKMRKDGVGRKNTAKACGISEATVYRITSGKLSSMKKDDKSDKKVVSNPVKKTVKPVNKPKAKTVIKANPVSKKVAKNKPVANKSKVNATNNKAGRTITGSECRTIVDSCNREIRRVEALIAETEKRMKVLRDELACFNNIKRVIEKM